MPDLVSVRFRDCSCPGTPHKEEGDIAQFRPYLDYDGGAEAFASISKRTIKNGEVITALLPVETWPPLIGPVYIRRGVVAWNLVDEDGEPVPVTREVLDDLRWEDAYELADKADDLYGEQVLTPFLRRMSASSKAGPTNGSTPPRSSGKRRTPSRRSSSPSSASGRNHT